MRFFSSKGKEYFGHNHKNMKKRIWSVICLIGATVAVSAALWLLFIVSGEKHLLDDILQHTVPVLSPQPISVQTPEPKPDTESEPGLEAKPAPEPDFYDDGIRDTDR